MIKLIVIDLDGTLLDNKKNISEENKRAIKKAIEKGVKVTIFTGRNYHSAKKYLEELDLDIPVTFQNGAFIMDFKSKKIIRELYLDADIARQAIINARAEGVFYILYKDFLSEKDMITDGKYNGPYKFYLKRNERRIIFSNDVLEYFDSRVAEVALVGKEQNIIRALKTIKKEEVSIIKSTTLQDHAFYEIFGPNCSKAIALHILEDHFKVKKEETMFIGDGYNDIEIMKIVGFPVAMENASEDVKRCAKFITKSNEESGVAYAIEKFVLKS
ncbi:MAG: HAD family phosphatase [Thermotogaceae bacterium]|nr:HAD family phosphatase [Thermotogaceae bacterium]